MTLIPIGPWKRVSTYIVHPLGLMDSTYRVPLLDSKLVTIQNVLPTPITLPNSCARAEFYSGVITRNSAMQKLLILPSFSPTTLDTERIMSSGLNDFGEMVSSKMVLASCDVR